MKISKQKTNMAKIATLSVICFLVLIFAGSANAYSDNLKSDVIISDPSATDQDEEIQAIILEAKYLTPTEYNIFQSSYIPSLELLTEKYNIERNKLEENAGHNLLSLIYGNNRYWEAELKKQEIYDSMVFFVTYDYGTASNLGAGERAGVIDSWKESKGLDDIVSPENCRDWEDIIKIANGRWPSVEPKNDYIKSKENIFKNIYLRNPDYNKQRDEAAMMIIAYGLRPSTRNIESENRAISFFKEIFKKDPDCASDWDIIRAIAYSGATR